jgi:hypothetical protein
VFQQEARVEPRDAPDGLPIGFADQNFRHLG